MPTRILCLVAAILLAATPVWAAATTAPSPYAARELRIDDWFVDSLRLTWKQGDEKPDAYLVYGIRSNVQTLLLRLAPDVTEASVASKYERYVVVSEVDRQRVATSAPGENCLAVDLGGPDVAVNPKCVGTGGLPGKAGVLGKGVIMLTSDGLISTGWLV